MNAKFFGLLAAASLAATACSQEKTTETVTTPAADSTAAVVIPDTLAAYDDARRLAARVAEDLKLTDTVVVTRIERTYYTRGRRLGEVETRYSADTAGRYAAARQVNDQADEEVRVALNSPEYYNTYSSNRAAYGDGPYSLAPARVVPVRRTNGVSQGTAVKKLEREGDGDRKTKYMNDAKVKVDDDGSRKVKLANGTKIKIDEDGNRKVKKPLFK